MKYAVVTGGGTSGHVIPAIAVIEALQDAGHAATEIAYVGSRRGVESNMVPATGVDCEYLPISGLQRSLNLRSIGRNVALPFRLLRSTLLARRLVRRWEPKVVVSVGGYASEPMARAAVGAGVPLVCISYDRIPGLATRRQSRKAAVCAVAFDGSELPRSVVTGAPVRRAARTMDPSLVRTATRASWGLAPDELLVTVVGGSLGSRVLNDSVEMIVERLATSGLHVRVHHVTGPRFTGGHTARNLGNVTVNVTEHEQDMPAVLAATDVLVSRAGASTIAEIASIGVASVLVPWPGAAENHQDANARWLSDNDAAIVVPESDRLGLLLSDSVERLAHDADLRSRLATRSRQMGGLNRGNSLVEAIEKAAHGR